jgi:GNAT superfamily N-acetyltransferase
MNYSVINPENVSKLGILPESMLSELISRGGFCVIAGNDDANAGIAVFTFASKEGEMLLRYIMVQPECRGQGTARGMFEYACGILKQGETLGITCRISGKTAYIVEMKEFLEALGFQITVPYDLLMEYRLSTILDNKKFHALLAKMPECIRSEKEISSAARNRFYGDLAAQGLVINNDDYDHELSRFYAKEEKVKGCILVKKEDDTLCMRLFHLSEGTADPVAFPGMLASCARASFESDRTDRIFRLHFRRSELKNSLTEVLGYPEYGCIFQEYRMCLQAQKA